jgi:ribose transport system ATP-binding protein
MNDSNTPPNAAVLLELKQIEKSFFGVKVVKGAGFQVRGSSVLGLVGENGAGKSTLMNIVGGNLRPDAGTMLLRGAGYAPQSPRDAARSGIAFVHQELNLFPNLSIAENLFLTEFPTKGPIVRRAELHGRAAELLKRVGLALSPSILVEHLSASERQLVEIARALSLDAKLIILDEPTTSLSAREADRLFALVRQLREEGRSCIYISHALADVLRLCDDVVVLRDGEVVSTGAARDYDLNRLVTLMVGRELKQLFPQRRSRTGVNGPENGALPRSHKMPLLELRHVTQPHIVRNISFSLEPGEVLGIAGLMGAGRSELARIIFGLDPFASGEILFKGKALARNRTRQRVRRGIAFMTESRREDGLCAEASLAENLALVALPNHTRSPFGLINPAGLRYAVSKMRESVRLQPRLSNNQPARTLSGGNQQKVVFAKWLLAQPQVFILDEPTRGIDIGAKSEIYQLILDRADAGCGVIIISSEIEELTGLCDRILVLNRGRISAELPRAQFDSETILRAALPDEVCR